ISYLSKPIIFVAYLVFLLKKDSISFNIFNKEPFKVALSMNIVLSVPSKRASLTPASIPSNLLGFSVKNNAPAVVNLYVSLSLTSTLNLLPPL
uniref:hypothetical protein n=1 Tax=Methanobrevibacter smithii TaxID=2173 RepID=UPI003FEF9474